MISQSLKHWVWHIPPAKHDGAVHTTASFKSIQYSLLNLVFNR